MTKTPEISVIILAHRDDALLQAAVQSARHAQEVIIAWTVLSDAPKFPDFSQVKVHVLPPVTDFSETRNTAMRFSSQPWVFFLDSDEVIAPEAWANLEQLASQKSVAGVQVRRIDIFLGKKMRWGEVGNVLLLRMFQRDAGHYVRAVHEVAKVQGKVVKSSVVLCHTPHRSISSFWQKIIVYTAQESQLRQQNTEHFSLLKLLLFPLGKFMQNYVWRLGFLDGWRGLVYAVCMSVHSATVRILQYEQMYAQK